jgi:hypothetical protein
MIALAAFVTAVAVPPLWTTNHTSQVKSIHARVLGNGPVVWTGSTFYDDESVSAIYARTGKLLWNNVALDEWTYGVALQPSTGGIAGAATFGCPFDTEKTPVPPCELGFWASATDKTLSWKVPVANAELSASAGAPSVAFTPDGQSIIVTFVDMNSTVSPGGEFVAVASAGPDPPALPLTRALLGSNGNGEGLHIATAAAGSALVSLPSATSKVHGLAHYGVTIGSDRISVDSVAAINCDDVNANCVWYAANANLSSVIVGAFSLMDSPANACPFQSKDALRWGFSYIGTMGTSAGTTMEYSREWSVCSTPDNTKALESVQLVCNETRVLVAFSNIEPGE